MTPEGQQLHDIIEMVYRNRTGMGYRHRKGVRQAAFKRVLLKVPVCPKGTEAGCLIDTITNTFREYQVRA